MPLLDELLVNVHAGATGTYALCIHVPDGHGIAVGKLGSIRFARGRYVYVGSALCGLQPRLRRHLSRHGKKMHWHVDFLLQYAFIEFLCFAETTLKKECDVSRFFVERHADFTPVPHFGNSDCSLCPSHLFLHAGAGKGGSLQHLVARAFTEAGLEPVLLEEPKRTDQEMI